MSLRLWRVFGSLAIFGVVLMFGAIAVEGMTPELGANHHDLVKGLLQGSLVSRFSGGYVEALSTIVFLLAALLLARLLRGRDEWTGWLASCISATAIINVGSGLIVGFPAGAAAIYDGHHGTSLETVQAVNDVRNFAFFLSVADLGVFTACVGAAILVTRLLPRWTGWTGIAIGVLCLASVAGARTGAHNITDLAQTLWWVVLGVLALRRRVAAPTRSAREVLAV